MSGIKFNQLTKEIEINGTESFIESNFNKIQDLLRERKGAKEDMLFRKTKRIPNQEPISHAKKEELQASAGINEPELTEALPTLRATEPLISEISFELKEKRPPLRKYIRYVGAPGHQKVSIQVAEQKPGVISITSLKEKFGLPETKIEGIIRDAEKLGKVRRTVNGSLVWTED